MCNQILFLDNRICQISRLLLRHIDFIFVIHIVMHRHIANCHIYRRLNHTSKMGTCSE